MERAAVVECLSKNKSLIILACQIVLQIDIRSGNQIILSDRKALLGSRVAFIFDRGWESLGKCLYVEEKNFSKASGMGAASGYEVNWSKMSPHIPV